MNRNTRWNDDLGMLRVRWIFGLILVAVILVNLREFGGQR